MPTTITISEFLLPDCNYLGTTAKLRRYYNQDWTDVDGVFHPEGTVGSSTGFFDEISCTLASNTLTVPSFSATPTDNPQTGSNVRETWQLWDQAGTARTIIFEGFIPSANPTITFGALLLLNHGQTLFESDQQTRLDQWIQSYIDMVLGSLRYATSVIAGWVRLSVPAVDLNDPVAIGQNDPDRGKMDSVATASLPAAGTAGRFRRITDAIRGFVFDTGTKWINALMGNICIEEYATLAAMISEIGTTQRTVYVPNSYACAANATIPGNITLKFTGQGSLAITTGVAVIIQGPVEASPRQIFTNVLSGQGTISFAGNKSLAEVNAKWFGATGDGVTDDSAALQAGLHAAGTLDIARFQVPAGVYLVNGALQGTSGFQGRLLLPYSSSVWRSIEISGDAPAEHAFGTVSGGYAPSNSGTIIKSTASGGAIFSTGTAGFVGIVPTFKNLTVRTADNPQSTAIDCRGCAGVHTENIIIDTGIYSVAQSEPTNSGAYGLRLPGLGNGAQTTVVRTVVTGYYYGIELGEHAHLDYVIFVSVLRAMVTPAAAQDFPITAGHITIIDCPRGLVVQGAAAIDFQAVVIEHEKDVDPTPPWHQAIYDLDNPSCLLRGRLRWHVAQEGPGNVDDFRVNGNCPNIDTSRIWTTIPAWTSIDSTGTFANGWTDFGAGEAVGAFRRGGDVVELRGMIKSGTVGAGVTAFTLPSAFRPGLVARCSVVSNGAFGYVTILTTGVVEVRAGSNVWVSLDGCRFSVQA